MYPELMIVNPFQKDNWIQNENDGATVHKSEDEEVKQIKRQFAGFLFLFSTKKNRIQNSGARM